MILREIVTTHMLELLLITISVYVAVKTYRTRNSSRVTKAFSYFAAVNALFQILDTCMVLNRSGVCFNGHITACIIYVVTLIVMAGTGYLWFIYVEEAIGSRTFDTGKKVFLWSIPLIVFSVLCIASVKTGWIFTFDAEGKYKIGSLFFLQYVVIFGYCLLAMVRSCINYFNKKERRSTDHTLLVIMFVDTVAVIIQLSFMVNVMNTALVLTVLLSYTTVYSSEIERIKFSLNQERLTKHESEQLIDGFANEYELSFLRNLKDASFRIIKGGGVGKALMGNADIAEPQRAYAERFVHPDDRAYFLGDYYSDTTVREKLAVGESYSYEYRSNSSGSYTWHRAVLTRISENEILLGFKKCDEEVVSRIVSEKVISDFASVFIVNLKDNTYRFVSRNSDSGFADVPGGVYTKTIEEYISRVNPDYREHWRNMLDLDKVRELLTENSRLEYVYPLENTEKRWRRCIVETLDAENGVPASFIMTYFVLDDESAENQELSAKIAEQKEQLEIKQNQLKESLAFTNFFLDTYISAYYVNLKDLTYQVYKRPEEQEERYPFIDNYYDSLKAYVNLDVYPEDRDELVQILAPGNVRNILKEEFEYAHFYKSLSSGGEKTIRVQIIRGADEDHAAIGFTDVTEEIQEQQKRFLGAMPLSNDVLSKANIGLWAFELDEGQPPRMYDDETMLGLVGLDHQVSPEEAYHAWYDHIDEGSYDLVTDAVNKMISGEHAEVQYPWHFPDGRTIMVRCGGIRNYEYTKGIRIEGTHQNVTETLHFDEEERERTKQVENDLLMAKLRADSLAYISDNEPDLDAAINFFGKRILEMSGCDQVIFREMDGHRLVLNAPGIKDIPQEICSQCPFVNFDSDAYGEDGIALMNDCREGCNGVMVHPDCPAKSSFMQQIYSGGELVGLFTIHYLNNQHTFTENGIATLKTVAIYLGLLIGRINEKQAEIARIEAESSNRAKTEFLFNMSHDIRTPMNAILGYTDIALNHIDEQDRVKDSLNKIKTSGGHLLSLINDILEMSRIEAGRIEIVNTPVNVYEVSDGIINMSQSLAATKDISFNAEITGIKNPYVYADELHTNQVIINLISNAIKYTNPGGTVDYRIEQISEPAEGIAYYRITVRDNGIGMSEAFQKHLFESFAREQTATVSKQEGAGLGLAIVKRIVDLIGGVVKVKSKQGEGSTFTVEMPLRVMDDAEIDSFVDSRHSDQNISGDIILEGRKILLVEDNELNREIATEILEEAGLIIEQAEDGVIAVRKVMENGTDYYDFILMDIQMPVMNGYEATAEIRKLPGGDKIPIIALSANAFKEDVDKSIAAGMNAHVAKPIKVKELYEALTKAL